MSFKHLQTDIDFGGSKTGYFYNESTGDILTRTNYDASALLEHTKRLRNSGTNGFNKDKSMRKIAELDQATILMLLKDHHIDVFDAEDMPRLKAWLRKPENAYYRTVDGKF